MQIADKKLYSRMAYLVHGWVHILRCAIRHELTVCRLFHECRTKFLSRKYLQIHKILDQLLSLMSSLVVFFQNSWSRKVYEVLTQILQ